MSISSDNLFVELFSTKIGKIDAILEEADEKGGVHFGNEGSDLWLEERDLIGDTYLCEAVLSSDVSTREWYIQISKSVCGRWHSVASYVVAFAKGSLTSLRGASVTLAR